MKLFIKIFFSKYNQVRKKNVNLVIFTEKILNEKPVYNKVCYNPFP